MPSLAGSALLPDMGTNGRRLAAAAYRFCDIPCFLQALSASFNVKAITDIPEKLRGFPPANTGWHAQRGGDTPSGQIALQRALGLREPVWEGDLGDPGSSAFWAQMLIVGRAPSSQFDTLGRMLGTGLRLPGPTACIALEGSNFHGHRGHPWMAAAGNLHLCVAIQPDELLAGSRAALTMLPAVAVVNAVRSLLPPAVAPGIKWVNDILVNGRKLAGVITSTQVMGNRFTLVLFGIGLNVAIAPPVPPSPLAAGAVSLAELTSNPSLAGVLFRLMQEVEHEFAVLEQAGAGRLLEAYRDMSLVVGREVVIWPESAGETFDFSRVRPIARGRVRAIHSDLSLLLEGSDVPVAKGRLVFADRCSPASDGPGNWDDGPFSSLP